MRLSDSPTGALPQKLTVLCLHPAPTAPTPSMASKENQSQTPSSVGFTDDPLPQDTSPALPLPPPLSPSLFQGEMCRSNTDGCGTDRAQGQTSGRTQGQGWEHQRWLEQEPRTLERNLIREGVKTSSLGQENLNCQVHCPRLPRRWVGPLE